MECRTVEQNKVLHALLSEAGAMEHKEELAYQYSNRRTTHTSELSPTECDELIRALQARVNVGKKMDAEKLHKARWRLRYALSNDWGFTILIKGQPKPDFARINAYTQKYWHKLIDDMSYDECRAKEASVRRSKNKPKNRQECHASPTPN